MKRRDFIKLSAGLGATMATTAPLSSAFAQTKMVLTQKGLPDEKLCQIVSQGTVESFDKLEQLLVAQMVYAL